jgi:hypothetical protein
MGVYDLAWRGAATCLANPEFAQASDSLHRIDDATQRTAPAEWREAAGTED